MSDCSYAVVDNIPTEGYADDIVYLSEEDLTLLVAEKKETNK